MKYEQLLLNWQVTYLLNQNEYTTPITERRSLGDEGARKFKRLYQLITQNLSFELFQAVRKAKEHRARYLGVCGAFAEKLTAVSGGVCQ